MADKSSGRSKNLPSEENEKKLVTSTEESEGDTEGLSTGEEEAGLEPKTKAGFQRLIAKKDRQIQELSQQLDEQIKRLAKLERAERERKLAEMSEAEKWKTIAQEKAAQAAKAELRAFASNEIAKRGLAKHPIAEIVLESPWAIPAVKKHLSEEPTWEETIEVVKRFLPPYLETLVEPESEEAKGESSSPPAPSETSEAVAMETERTSPVATKKRVWTRAELRELAKDPAKYMKYQKEITQAFAEGRIRG